MDFLKEEETLIELKKYQLAIDRLLNKLPSEIGNGRIYYLLSFCYRATGNYEKAGDYINVACKIDPHSVVNLNEKAQVEFSLGNIEVSRSILFSSLRIQPIQIEAHLLMASIHLATNEIDRAATSAKKALAISPENTQARNMLILTHLTQNKLAEGKKVLDEVLKVDPTNAFSLSNLAMYQSFNKKHIEASEILKQLIRIDPENIMLKRNLRIAIISRNFIIRNVLSLSRFIQISKVKSEAIFLIITMIFLGAGLILSYQHPSKTIDIILFFALLYYIGIQLLLMLLPQFGIFILLQDKLGRHIVGRKELMWTIISILLLLLGITGVLRYFINGNYIESSNSLLVGMFIIYLSTLAPGLIQITMLRNQIIVAAYMIIFMGLCLVVFAVDPHPFLRMLVLLLIMLSIFILKSNIQSSG